MATSLKKLLIGTSVAVGISAVGITPALAGSLTNATIGGTASTDYLIYGKEGNKTVVIPNSVANLQSVLDGNAVSPTGNVELFAASEKPTLSPVANANVTQKFTALNSFLGYTGSTVLTGQIGGKDISLSSLTAADWFGVSAASTVNNITNALKISNQVSRINSLNSAISGLYNPSNLATKWFGETLSKYGMTSSQTLFSNFLLAGGFQRFSDPNISYVNQDNKTGKITIGLAGHYDAASLLGLPSNPNNPIPNPNNPIQVSEVVKYSYNGNTNYLYNFFATASKLTAADDGKSHNGNYEVGFDGVAPAPVPEPSTILGLIAVGGLFGAAKRNANKKA
ncbi:NF038130 family PEP-CTERM protein [Planktothrix agardhii]|uniref:NF038130 family PEP-CTERM protein n=1 Tax=Planktothrix agardhii TaxID=1160 RepID=UPI0003FDA0CA|nr:NF038130 family PEP-CTERM protein [Planktothrix agardhii]CAD0221602.1 conserved hypothetical protein [Planktothrix agardhii]